MLQPAFHSAAIRWQFARYLAIGGTVFCVDIGSFQLFMRAGLALALAVTLSYGLAISAHFTLNKYLNFRSHDRTVGSQLSTYLAVAFVLWLISLGVVEVAFRVFGLTPLLAKLLAIAINVPLGFLGHRYLTFGAGISAQIKRILRA
ncbi:MAG TPA: GtrA family protein [Candidatus Rubrimentiphilum sp.]|nr:GtrA family protein [Candidatus Rubrimentiphilum sp.]